MGDFLGGKVSYKKINLVITFDDGYKSWLNRAVPFLRELGLPATFFVTSGFINLSIQEEAEFIRSKLSIKLRPQGIRSGLDFEDLKSIAHQGFSIGGHTLNHYNLGELRDRGLIRFEISEDKKRLEKLCGMKIEYFSYPFGSYFNPKINLIDILKESGYKGAVTTVSGFNSIRSNPYLLHREITPASMSGLVFRARIYGNYDAVSFIKKFGLKMLRALRQIARVDL